MKKQQKKKIPAGKIEIQLAPRRVGNKEIPGKFGSFDDAEKASEFFETERPQKKRRRHLTDSTSRGTMETSKKQEP